MTHARERAGHVSALASALEAESTEQRRQATSHLAELDLRDALPLLMRALGDADWRVRKEATIAARSFVPDRSLINALIHALGPGDNVGLRNAAVEVLASSGHSAAAAVADAMSSLDEVGRKLAVEALGRSRDQAALGPLEAALFDPDDNVRQAAVEAIAAVGAVAGEPAHKILVRCLQDDDRFIRLASLEGLNSLGVAVPWSRLEPLLEDPTSRTAALMAAALAEHPQAPAALARAIGSSRGGSFAQTLGALARLAEGTLAASVADAIRERGADLTARLVHIASGEGGDPEHLRASALVLAALVAAPGATEAAILALGDPTLATSAQRALATRGPAALPALITWIAPPALDAGMLQASPVSDELPLWSGTFKADLGSPSTPPRATLRVEAPSIASSAAPKLTRRPEPEIPTITAPPIISRPPSEGAIVGASAAPPEEPAVTQLRAAAIDVALAIVTDDPAGSRASLPDLLTALRAATRAREKDVATSALYALSHLGTEDDLALAAELALSPAIPIASSAEAALTALVGRYAKTARALCAEIMRREPVSLPGAVMLGALGATYEVDAASLKDDFEFLSHCTAAGDARTRRAAVMSVAQIGGPLASEVLSFALADEDRDVQLEAARALGRLCTDPTASRFFDSSPPSGPPSSDKHRTMATDVLELLGRSGDSDLVAAAVSALGDGMTTLAPPSMPPSSGRGNRPSMLPGDDLIAALTPLASKAPSNVAIAAVDALSRAPVGTPGRLSGLIGALGHPNAAVTKAAMLKLEVIEATAEKIARCLDHPSHDVRLLAAEMLAGASNAAARERLARRAPLEHNQEVREAIERAIAAIDRRDGGAAGS